MTNKPQLLIDGDLYLYQACTSAEFQSDCGEDTFFLSTNIKKAQDHWLSKMDSFTRALESDDLVIVLSGPENFRKNLTPDYKANRKAVRKPLGFVDLKEWLYEQYPDRVVMNPLLEADDYLGILATKPNATVQRIIVSDDKDMQTLPATIYRNGDIFQVDEDSAEEYWLTQTLTGDSADGYKGCPGIGAVKAKAILSKAGSRWENVRRAFLNAGLTEDDAILQARLARILRFEDWDSKTKTVRLWTPDAA